MDGTTSMGVGEMSSAHRINLLRAGRRRWALRRTEELAAEHIDEADDLDCDAMDLFAEVAS